MTTSAELPRAPLAGIRVIDAATLFAGPLAATLLADYGADVIKVEHPQGDSARRYGVQHEGVGLWWKVMARNKRAITLNLSSAQGKQLFLALAADVDVVIENFRPGTLERWGLDYPTLAERNPRLILARVTGFGQFGPYAHRPAFGTLAEAMSGLASISGEPDGPPMLPSFPLADNVAGLTTAFAIMTALRAREASGHGQVVDLAIVESTLAMLGAQVAAFDATGKLPVRSGNRSPNNAPRNVYRTADGCWVALSTSAQNIAERVMRLVGRPELVEQPWFVSGQGRAAHADVLDGAVAEWIAQRSCADVLAQFEQAQAAVAPIYDIADVMRDPHYAALGSIISVDDQELGAVRMHNLPFRLSATPGAVRWAGPRLGEHNQEILGPLGLSAADISRLQAEGVL